MSNLLVNVRAFAIHFQIARDWPFVRVSLNPWHKRNGWPDGYFSVYKFFR